MVICPSKLRKKRLSKGGNNEEVWRYRRLAVVAVYYSRSSRGRLDTAHDDGEVPMKKVSIKVWLLFFLCAALFIWQVEIACTTTWGKVL